MKIKMLFFGFVFAVRLAFAQCPPTTAFDWADINEDVSGQLQWVSYYVPPDASVNLQPDAAFHLSWNQTSGDKKDVWITDFKIDNFYDSAALWAVYGQDAAIQFDYSTLNGDTVFVKIEYDVYGGSNYYGKQSIPLKSGVWKTATLKLADYTFHKPIGTALSDSVPGLIKIGLNNSPFAAKDLPINFLIDNIKVVNAADPYITPTIAFDWGDIDENLCMFKIAPCFPEGVSANLQPDAAFHLSWDQTSGDQKNIWITDVEIDTFHGNANLWSQYGQDAAIQFDYSTLNGDTVFVKIEYDVDGGSNYYGKQSIPLKSGVWKTMTLRLADYTFYKPIGTALSDSFPGVIKIGLNNSPFAAKDVPINFLIDNIKVINSANSGVEPLTALDWADIDGEVESLEWSSPVPGASANLQPDAAYHLFWPQTSSDQKDQWIIDLKITNFFDNPALWAQYGQDAAIQFDYTTLNGDTVFAKFEYDVEGGSTYYGNQVLPLASGVWKTFVQKLSDYTFHKPIGNAIDSVPSTIKIGFNNSPIAAKDKPINFLIDNIRVTCEKTICKSSKCSDIKEKNAYSISNIELFPNPVVNSLKLRNITNGADIVIYELSGRKIISLKNIANDQSILVNGLSPGLYILRACNADKQQIIKFVKQ